MRKIILVILLCLCGRFVAAQDQLIQDYIQNTLNTTFSVLNDSSNNLAKTQDIIKTMLNKNLDFDTMARQVLGPQIFGNISDEDFIKFKAVYTKYLVSSYAEVVKKYDGQRVNIKSVTQNALGVYVVQTNILSNNGATKFNITYQVGKNKSGDFVIQDVISENISLISSQRSDFASVLANNPKNINNLILRLSARIN